VLTLGRDVAQDELDVAIGLMASLAERYGGSFMGHGGIASIGIG